MEDVEAGPGTGEWLVDDVVAWLNGFLDTDRLLAIAWRLGAATADVHTALSGSRRSSVGARTYFIEATTLLHEVLDMGDLDVGEHLREHDAAVRAALEPLRSDRLLPAHRVHGDLTAARFHAVEAELLLELRDEVDEWSPDLPQSPLVDVATLLQSVDHSCRVAAHRSGRSHGDRVERLVSLLADAVVQAYSAVHAVDDELLRALRVLSELRHHAWIAAGRHEWVWLAEEAMPGLLEGAAR